ncbi:MAG: AMP-binding protein [Candidatus Binatia bacterium]
MSNLSGDVADPALRQPPSRSDRVRPTNPFVKFKKEDIEQSIPDRFEKMVRLYPDRLAVKTRDHQLTYDELNKAANRVAHAILEQRGKGNEPVALLFEHGASAIAAILGVLKAGKIYVPLDPSYPLTRLRYVLEDSQAAFIVTDKRHLSLAGELSKDMLPGTNIDEIGSHLSDKNLGLTILPGAFAYILYTSGSTGQPKGVVENHRNLLHGVLRTTNGLHICAHDRVSLTHSYCASASVRRIFPGLLNGASLHLLDVKREGMHSLANFLIEEEITFFSMGRIRDFIHTLSGEQQFPKLRLVSFGGDLVYKRDVALCKRHLPRDCLVGIWMSTTETGTVTQYFIDKETQIVTNIVPIGYPVEGIEVILLNDEGREVGVNQPGEIAVKSRYLSPGYWRRPELTKSKFLPDPDGGEARVYLTGDLGRMRPDGCFVRLGRKDNQVKIRGYRVEVAETEAALVSLDIVKSAFVMAQEESAGVKRLVAYLVPYRQPAPTASTLRRKLAETLPDYMLPSVFVTLDAFPLTPTGKIDRRALPEPDNTRPKLDTAYVAPRTQVEKELAEIWAKVLSFDKIGIHDNFFDLGGHSLLATRVISRVISTFKVELPIKTLFESPTVADMAQIIIQNDAKLAGDKELARMLAELDTLSDEEAKRLLADEGKV